jgi:hypothetical protein
MPKRIIIKDSSFTNLFPEIKYDRSEVTNSILDIWNNLRLVTFPKGNNSMYIQYLTEQNDTLYNLSFKFYSTIDYWWLTPLINDVEDPFVFLDDVRSGNFNTGLIDNRIKILKSSFIPSLLRNITVIKNIQSDINEKEALRGGN